MIKKKKIKSHTHPEVSQHSLHIWIESRRKVFSRSRKNTNVLRRQIKCSGVWEEEPPQAREQRKFLGPQEAVVYAELEF